jgi:hypothetical protein
MKTFTITLDENEYLLLESLVADGEEIYTEPDEDMMVGDELAIEIYARLQKKFQ